RGEQSDQTPSPKKTCFGEIIMVNVLAITTAAAAGTIRKNAIAPNARLGWLHATTYCKKATGLIQMYRLHSMGLLGTGAE
ncbi:MAG: hypothetical protein EA401_14625, partial [Planctomycetota bacterium]